jgi:hypothetical protein
VRLDLVWQMTEEGFEAESYSGRTDVPMVTRTQKSHGRCISYVPSRAHTKCQCGRGKVMWMALCCAHVLCAKRASPKVLSRSPLTVRLFGRSKVVYLLLSHQPLMAT